MVDTANTVCIHTIEQMQNFTIFLQADVWFFLFSHCASHELQWKYVCAWTVFTSTEMSNVCIFARKHKNTHVVRFQMTNSDPDHFSMVSGRAIGSLWFPMFCFHFQTKTNKQTNTNVMPREVQRIRNSVSLSPIWSAGFLNYTENLHGKKCATNAVLQNIGQIPSKSINILPKLSSNSILNVSDNQECKFFGQHVEWQRKNNCNW